MSEEDIKNEIPSEEEFSKTAEPTEDESPQKGKKRGKKDSETEVKNREKEVARYKKEWEDSLVASKRVKREELKRKFKRVMLIMLVFSLITTSIVYLMLLLIEENNIRITAKSSEESGISLSIDRSNWTPYLDMTGPTSMWNTSFNPNAPIVAEIPRFDEIAALVSDPNSMGGNYGADQQKTNIIEFCFFLRNEGGGNVPFVMNMTLASNEKGLEDSIRIIWAEGYSQSAPDRENSSVKCYASRATDERMAYNNYVEKVAYPETTYWTTEDFQHYEQGEKAYGETYQPINLNDGQGNPLYNSVEQYLNTTGYVNTVPFFGDSMVLDKESYLVGSEILCVYVCVWIEGSDKDCTDAALGGYVTLAINFSVI